MRLDGDQSEARARYRISADCPGVKDGDQAQTSGDVLVPCSTSGFLDGHLEGLTHDDADRGSTSDERLRGL
jgi:hypothetical protein